MPQPILYSSWVCPFAQRAWISLLEKGVDFELKEVDLKNKSADFLAVSPRGLVPALVHGDGIVYESMIVSEYIDEAWLESEVHLFPPITEPLERAKTRIHLDNLEKVLKPVRTLYYVPGSKSEAAEAVEKELEAFFKNAAPESEGPFFYGQKFGIIDIALAPFIGRIEVLKDLIGAGIPKTENLKRFHIWWEAVQERPSFKDTLLPKEKFVSYFHDKFAATEKSP